MFKITHTGIFATSDEILVKAGENYDTSITEARINALCLQVESLINCRTRYNWSDAFAGLNADVKYLLAMLESDLVAMYILCYNMDPYTRAIAETMLDVYKDNIERGFKVLEDTKAQDFMINA